MGFNQSPKTVRNYYVTGKFDGRKTPIDAGPSAARDSGIEVKVHVRHNGEVTSPIEVWGCAVGDSIEALQTRVKVETKDMEGVTLFVTYRDPYSGEEKTVDATRAEIRFWTKR